MEPSVPGPSDTTQAAPPGASPTLAFTTKPGYAGKRVAVSHVVVWEQ